LNCIKENKNTKINAEVINILNEHLADELTAVSQYMVHSEMLTTTG
jgi:bacterioferritin (cytochrome b1)